MKLTFPNLPESLNAAVTILAEPLTFTLDEAGRPVHVTLGSAHLVVTVDAQRAEIQAPTTAAFCRGLTKLVHAIAHQQTLTIDETPQFTTAGVMIDLSRNAVLTLAGLKQLILTNAKLGLNATLLYMEDTYAVDQYPFWGYQRGRFSEADLRAADDFADALGIELIPCIQTLSHLANPMRWPDMNSVQDTANTLLVDDPKTYVFIKNLLEAATRPFRSKQIHIGMDQANDLGRGEYLRLHGLVDQTEIMLSHIKKVAAITDELGLKPIMWSDMWSSAEGYVYGDENVKFSEEIRQQIPAVTQMYYDYFSPNQAHYEALLERHKDLGQPVNFATSIWTWNGIAPNYGKTFQTMTAGLNAAKAVGIDTVYATIWADDGAETPYTAGALGLQDFAEQAYHHESPTEAQLAEAFAVHQNKVAADYLLLDQFDQLPTLTAGNPAGTNPSKIVLYQDLLYPLYAANLKRLNLADHYQKLAKALDAVQPQEDDADLFAFYQALAHVLVAKVLVMQGIRGAYVTSDVSRMKSAIAGIASLKANLQKLQAAHRTLWFAHCSPFGWEVLDTRYGGLIARCDSAVWRLTTWCDAPGPLAELDEPSLTIDPVTPSFVGRGNYLDIISTSKL